MAKTRNARGALKLLSPEPDSATLSCDKNFGQRPHAVPVGHYAFLLGQAPWTRRGDCAAGVCRGGLIQCRKYLMEFGALRGNL